jgi:RNA recognition motif-containing protein
MAKKIVGNLDFTVTEGQIRRLFDSFGDINEFGFVTDWETGHSRGFAFVEMDGRKDAEKAIRELREIQLEGRSLTIRTAPPVLPTGIDSLSLGGE